MDFQTFSRQHLKFEIILIASFLQNLNFKIQMLAGKSLKIYVSTGSQISTTLVVSRYLPTIHRLSSWLYSLVMHW